MKRPRHDSPSPPPTTLGQQKADFTAEGAPPPGHVATTPPATVVRPAAPRRAAPKTKRLSSARYP